MKKPILTSGLSLVYYRPTGADVRRTCAAIWEESGHVRLVSPFLRSGSAVPLERAMEWFDSVCFAAQTCAQVLQACLAQPEWGIECVCHDAADRTLGLGSLAKPLVTDKALRRELARQCLLQTIQCLLKEDSAFADVRVDVLEPDNTTGDVATLALANGNATRICLLKKVSRTDVIRRGILAMDRMAQPASTWQHTLLVMPGLEIERPMFLGRSVTICSLDCTMLHHALQAQLPTQR